MKNCAAGDSLAKKMWDFGDLEGAGVQRTYFAFFPSPKEQLRFKSFFEAEVANKRFIRNPGPYPHLIKKFAYHCYYHDIYIHD